MTDWPLPPYFEPRGPLGDDEAVVRAFLGAEPGPPHSERLHVEGPVLLVERDVPAVLRIGARSVLVRIDLPDDLSPARETIEEVLAAEGLTMLDHDTMLALPVAAMMVALRLSSWDLWGADIDEAFADLRTAAVGGQGDVLLGGGQPPVGPEG
jgi:hypothetical protein